MDKKKLLQLKILVCNMDLPQKEALKELIKEILLEDKEFLKAIIKEMADDDKRFEDLLKRTTENYSNVWQALA